MVVKDYDILVIGSGIAGLTFALNVDAGYKVALITKKDIAESNTNYAQGGVAAVISDDDSLRSHKEDTMKAGSYLSDEDAVDMLVKNGKDSIEWLLSLGVEFSKDRKGELELGIEGGHSARRIVHAADKTGANIESVLVDTLKKRENVEIFENNIAVNLITCASLDHSIKRGSKSDAVLGLYVLDLDTDQIYAIRSKVTFLATGGAGKVFLYTSNPDIASGDGFSLAFRAGALISNMEFVQFHPTCLYHPIAKSFLISEAVRGEGAILLDSNKRAFMKNYHKQGSLAPRDVVSLAIDTEMKKAGVEYLFLDTTRIDSDLFKRRFPHIYDTTLRYGYDPTKEPLPIAPAAHYICGGVRSNLDGESTLRNLFVSGEVSYTGVHGANRLASNSLLEALVFSKRAALKACSILREGRYDSNVLIPNWSEGKAFDDDEKVVIHHIWDETRRLMWNYVGVARTNKRLYRAKDRLIALRKEINDYYWKVTISYDLVELRNLVDTASLIVESAISRRESIGLHFNLDYPEADNNRLSKETLIDRELMRGHGWSEY